MSDFDVIIAGAGMAGASLAAGLASAGQRVLLLEAEDQPGYHSTGRSAALWHESYGGPGVQPLTSASGPFLASPPPDFAARGFLTPRGALNIARRNDAVLIKQQVADFADTGIAMERVDRAAMVARVPGLRKDWTAALWEPDCADIDVGALHGSFLGAARRAGANIAVRAPLTAARWLDGHWHVEYQGGTHTCALLVNAAGAWADDVAVRAGVAPLNIRPFRRTMVQLRIDPSAQDTLPLVRGIDGSFYFRPESGGRIWLSPHDEIASVACDAAAEEIDVAIAIDRFEQVVDWQIRAVERKWAGLRSFAPDRLPVIGRDAAVPSFFWFAGQGGFGIQTAPAASWLAVALIVDTALPPEIAGIDVLAYSPGRLT